MCPGGQPIACPSVYLGEDVLSFIPFCDDTGEPWPFPAFSFLGIRKTGGLLVRAGELCTIIRISYLSPFFPFVLGVELWRYIQRLIQPSDRSMQTPRLCSSLRLFEEPLWRDVDAAGKRMAQVDPSMAILKRLQKQVRPRRRCSSANKASVFQACANFNTVESSAGAPPLSPGQKFHLMYKNSVDPFVFGQTDLLPVLARREIPPDSARAPRATSSALVCPILIRSMAIYGDMRSFRFFSGRPAVFSFWVREALPIGPLLSIDYRLV